MELVRSYYALLKGEPLPYEPPARPTRAAAIRFVFPEPGQVQSIDGLEDARSLEGVVRCDVNLQAGDRTPELRSSWDRVGHALASGPSAADAAGRAEEAVRRIQITVVPA
jgi:hypothetical protein